MTFDLFKLRSKEDKIRGWILVSLKNPNVIKKDYLNLLNITTQKQITEKININLSVGQSTIEKHLENTGGNVV